MEAETIVRTTNAAVAPLAPGGLARVPILHPVSLSIRQGEWVSLIGRNGSGKSTLAKAIAGMPLDGLSGIVERNPGESGAMPIVMQHPDAGLIGATPWEDVVLMLEQWGTVEGSRIPMVAEDTLRKLGLGNRQHQPIDTLSGGQKQLTAIAGCLAASPKLLILDEVTAMLDPDMSAYVRQEVRELNRAGMAVLWITQKLDELKGDDTVWAMSDGKVVYEGEGSGFYSRSGPDRCDSPAESLGFEAPYAVRVGWELEAIGIPLSSMPLRPEELEEAVRGR